MSVSFYFAGRNKRPTQIKVEKADSELENILSAQSNEANSPYCRYYLGNRLMKPKSIKHITQKQVQGDTLVVLGEEFRSIPDEELLKPLTLYLRQPDSKTIKTVLKPIDSILKVKELLKDKYGIPTDQWSVFYKGKELANDYQLLLEYEVADKGIIHSVPKQPTNNCEVEVIFASRKLRKTLNIDLTKSVKELKEEIAKVIALPSPQQILVYCGGEMFDQQTVSIYHVSQGAQIFLLDKNDLTQVSRVDWFKGKQQEDIQKVEGQALEVKKTNSKEELDNLTQHLQPQSILPKEEVKSEFISSGLSKQNSNSDNEHNQKHYPYPTLTIDLAPPSVLRQPSVEAPSPFLALKEVYSPSTSLVRDKSTTSDDAARLNTIPQTFAQPHQQGLVNTISPAAGGSVLDGVELSGEGSSDLILNKYSSEEDKERNPLSKARIQLNAAEGLQIKQVETVIKENVIPDGNLLEYCKQVESMIEKSEHTQSEAFLDQATGLLPTGNNRVTQSLKQKSSGQKTSPVYISTIERSPSQQAALNQSIQLIPIQIMVSKPSGPTICENVSPDDSIESIKRRIELNHGYPLQKQTLRHQGSVIENSKFVREIDLGSEAQVELSIEE